jgi:hypothetical protein
VSSIWFDLVESSKQLYSSYARIGTVERLNVAITRARFALKILANVTTLASSPTWDGLAKDAQARGCFLKASDCLAQLDLPTKKLESAKFAEKVSHLRVPILGMRVRPTDGLHTASDLELELGSVWRIVFTKTCKQEIQQLDKAMASNLVKCFGVFAKGYPAKACRVGHDIRERTNFVKKLPIRDRTLLWSVRMLSVPDISPNAQRSYTYSQAIWIWAFPPNSDLEAMIRSIRNACEGFMDEFMDLCSAQNWIERRVLPLSIT